MSTRKPKSPLLSPFEVPEMRLQLITVEVKQSNVPVNARGWRLEESALLDRLLPPEKKRLH